MARWIMIAGMFLFAIGAIMHFTPGLLGWFGRLPGDIHIETENGNIFIPITSMIVVSVVLSLLLTLLANIFRK